MPPSTAGASRTDANPTLCFSIIADADPGLMHRVMSLFAKRALLPTYWCSRADETELTIDLQTRDLDPETGRYIAACFRQFPGVRTVLTSEKQ